MHAVFGTSHLYCTVVPALHPQSSQGLPSALTRRCITWNDVVRRTATMRRDITWLDGGWSVSSSPTSPSVTSVSAWSCLTAAQGPRSDAASRPCHAPFSESRVARGSTSLFRSKELAPNMASDLRELGGAGWTRTTDRRIMRPPWSGASLESYRFVWVVAGSHAGCGISAACKASL